LWPDFDGRDLEAAIVDFRRRERRFGGLPSAGAPLPVVSRHEVRIS
jgi:undecaprenyl diphosphate synthase